MAKKEVIEAKKLTSKQLDEEFGSIPGVEMGSKPVHEEIKYVYGYDCPPIDIPSGGGIVGGKIYEIFGEESHGKSTFALENAKTFCDYWSKVPGANYRVFWVESESAFDKVRAAYLGCDLTKFMFFKTDVFEDGRDRIRLALDKAQKQGVKLFIVWDTIAATATRNEKDANAEVSGVEDDGGEDDGKSKTNPGGMMEKPRLIKAMFRDMTHLIGETQSTFVIVNQVSLKKGAYQFSLDSTGGHALKHHASVRAKIHRMQDLDNVGTDGKSTIYAYISEMSFIKNKLTGYTKYKVPMYFDIIHGLDKIETRLLYLRSSKIIPGAAGGWTTIKIPTGYATKPTDKVEMIEIKYQGNNGFKNMIKKYPHMIDWFDLLTYKTFCSDNPLVKIKNIDKLWVYEEKFYGQRITKLTEEEKNAANIMYDDLVHASDMEVEEKPVETVVEKEKKAGPKLPMPTNIKKPAGEKRTNA